MSLRPDALDYEELFPTNRRPARDSDSFTEDSFGSTINPKRPNSQDQTCALINDKPKETSASIATSSSGSGESSTYPGLVAKSRYWIRRRGHVVSFLLLFLFSIVLYLRPYEFFPGLSSFKSMAFYTGLVTLLVFGITQLITEGNLTARPKEINLVLLLGMAAILSMPLATYPGEAWEKFSEFLLKTIVIFIVFVNVVRTELRLKMLLWLILAVSVYLSVNAIYDYQNGLFLVGALETHDARIAGRIRGLFENSNDLALHLVTMIPIAIALGLSRAGLFRKLIYFGGAAIMVGAVIVTFSRGGFLGLVASVLVLARRLGRKNQVATTGALVFAVIMFLALAPGAYSSRLSTIFDSSADLTESASQRTDVLKRSFWVALRYPLFGVGIGNFHHKSIQELETHNAYTQVAAEMGIAAMVVYILFLIHPLRRLRLIENETRSKPEQKKFYYLAVGLQSSLIAFMVSSFFASVAYQWYVYYLVGYAVCLHRIFIMKFQSENDFARNYWEHPFAKRTEKLVSGQTASELGHV